METPQAEDICGSQKMVGILMAKVTHNAVSAAGRECVPSQRHGHVAPRKV